jgi:hypothetical protein
MAEVNFLREARVFREEEPKTGCSTSEVSAAFTFYYTTGSSRKIQTSEWNRICLMSVKRKTTERTNNNKQAWNNTKAHIEMRGRKCKHKEPFVGRLDISSAKLMDWMTMVSLSSQPMRALFGGVSGRKRWNEKHLSPLFVCDFNRNRFFGQILLKLSNICSSNNTSGGKELFHADTHIKNNRETGPMHI